MKSISRKIIPVFLFLIFAFNAKTQTDTLTIGEAFNWKVGDTLVYSPYRNFIFHPNPGFPIGMTYRSALLGFTVLSKQDFQDSVIYQLHYFNPDSIENVIIRNIDSTVEQFTGLGHILLTGTCNCIDNIPVCDSQALHCNLTSFYDSTFGGRLTIINDIPLFESGYGVTFVAGVGLKHESFSALEFGFCGGQTGEPGACGIDLAYYHSDSLLWIDSALYFSVGISDLSPPTPSFRLSPNPASDEINITRAAENNSPYDVYIYDITGKCVAAHKNIFDNMANINVLYLRPGYYFLKLTDRQGAPASKGFIISH